MSRQLGTAVVDRKVLSSRTECFGIFKPDALSMGIVSDIKRSIGEIGLKVDASRFVQLKPEDVMVIWPSIENPHVSRTVPYMTSAPVELFIAQGNDASAKMLKLKYYYRSLYPSHNPVVSVMHTTDHDEELQRCWEYFYAR